MLSPLLIGLTLAIVLENIPPKVDPIERLIHAVLRTIADKEIWTQALCERSPLPAIVKPKRRRGRVVSVDAFTEVLALLALLMESALACAHKIVERETRSTASARPETS